MPNGLIAAVAIAFLCTARITATIPSTSLRGSLRGCFASEVPSTNFIVKYC